MVLERWAATLTPCCVLQVWWVKRRAPELLLCHTFFSLPLVPIKKKNGCSVLHALADLHNAIPPPPAAPQNKSGLRRIAAHRLRALYCCWIIQELAERKRQGEWGVCTLSPGETGAKRRNFFRGVSYCSEKPKNTCRRQAQGGRGKEPLLFVFTFFLTAIQELDIQYSTPASLECRSLYLSPISCLITCHNIITLLGPHKPHRIARPIRMWAASISNSIHQSED